MQLLLVAMRFSASTFMALIKLPVFEDKAMMDAAANLVLEALNLVKASISDVKVRYYPLYKFNDTGT